MTIPEMWRAWARTTAPEPIAKPCSISANEVKYDVVIMHADSMSLTGNKPVWYCWTHRLGFDYHLRVPSLSGQLGDRCPVSRLEEWRARVWEAAVWH